MDGVTLKPSTTSSFIPYVPNCHIDDGHRCRRRVVGASGGQEIRIIIGTESRDPTGDHITRDEGYMVCKNK